MNRIAVISDVHGNRWALESVLEDIDREGILEVINLGDVFYGPLDPLGTAEILFERDFPTVSGNEDRIIIDRNTPASETLLYVRNLLQKVHFEWLHSLKLTLKYGDIFAFHSTPVSDSDYLFWDVRSTGTSLRSLKEVAPILDNIESMLILCGHDHVPRTMTLPDHRKVVNPGSVGLPAYWDDVPHPHVMGTGTPHAHYSIISRTKTGWSVSNRSVPYDWNSAAEMANRNGRPDWAEWLRTGYSQMISENIKYF